MSHGNNRPSGYQFNPPNDFRAFRPLRNGPDGHPPVEEIERVHREMEEERTMRRAEEARERCLRKLDSISPGRVV